MKKYRPIKLEIKNTEHDGFKVVDAENDDYQLATILEFRPINSDLPVKETRELEQICITRVRYYKKYSNYKKYSYCKNREKF